MLPNFESLKNDKYFLIMYIIIQLYHGESTGVKGDWMNFIFFIHNRKDYSESIVQSISFHNKLSIGNPVHENKNRDEYFLQGVESTMIGEIELPENVLPGETYQWNNNI